MSLRNENNWCVKLQILKQVPWDSIPIGELFNGSPSGLYWRKESRGSATFLLSGREMNLDNMKQAYALPNRVKL